MARLNPTRITWQHSGQREDGTTVDLAGLAYNLYANGEAVASFPGALNADGSFEMLFADTGWEPAPGQVHTITLRAFEIATELESADSNPIEIQFVGKPHAPGQLAAG